MKTDGLFTLLLFAAIACGCTEHFPGQFAEGENDGAISVCVRYMDAVTKALDDDVTITDEEKIVKSISILVFDAETGHLAAVKSMKGMGEDCMFRLPVGAKTVCALVNGPDVSHVTNISQLESLTDRLQGAAIATHGLTMYGKTECMVSMGSLSEQIVVDVKWLVSRVVLRNVNCNLPQQYGEMRLDCVYLGNANTTQTLSGTSSDMVNINGREDSGAFRPIGKNDVSGTCADYMFREMGAVIHVGDTFSEKKYLYCQPNSTSDCTCLYLLTTIGDAQYYYRVLLDECMEANSTCSIDVVITNLGSPVPPDGDLQKGEIKAFLTIHGWTVQDDYVIEF